MNGAIKDSNTERSIVISDKASTRSETSSVTLSRSVSASLASRADCSAFRRWVDEGFASASSASM